MAYLIDLFERKLIYDGRFLRNSLIVFGVLIILVCFQLSRMAEVSYKIDSIRNIVMREWCIYRGIDINKYDSLVKFNNSDIAKEFDANANKLKYKSLNPFHMPDDADFDKLNDIIYIIPAYL